MTVKYILLLSVDPSEQLLLQKELEVAVRKLDSVEHELAELRQENDDLKKKFLSEEKLNHDLQEELVVVASEHHDENLKEALDNLRIQHEEHEKTKLQLADVLKKLDRFYAREQELQQKLQEYEKLFDEMNEKQTEIETTALKSETDTNQTPSRRSSLNTSSSLSPSSSQKFLSPKRFSDYNLISQVNSLRIELHSTKEKLEDANFKYMINQNTIAKDLEASKLKITELETELNILKNENEALLRANRLESMGQNEMMSPIATKSSSQVEIFSPDNFITVIGEIVDDKYDKNPSANADPTTPTQRRKSNHGFLTPLERKSMLGDKNEIVKTIFKDLMIGNSVEGKIYLGASKGGVMERKATLRKKIPKTSNNDHALYTEPTLDTAFECVISQGDEMKKLRFKASDIKGVRKGKGRGIPLDLNDNFVLNINIDGKGESVLMSVHMRPHRYRTDWSYCR
jgi:hypothetical protein